MVISTRFAFLAVLSTVLLASVVCGGHSTTGRNVNGTAYHRHNRPQQQRNQNGTCGDKYCLQQEHRQSGYGEGVIMGANRALRQKEVLKHTSVIYGLISIAEREELSEQCYDELQQIYEGIQQKEIWALKVLDASGTQAPGFMWGHNHWIGSEKGCDAARSPLSITLSNRYRRNMKPNLVTAMAPFDVNYRMVYARHQSAWQVEMKFLSENILHIGVCVPQSCSNGELLNLTGRYFDEGIIQAQDIFEFKPDVLQVKDMKLAENFWNKKSVLVIGICTAATLMVVLLAHNREQKANEHKPSTISDGNDSTYSPVLKGTPGSYLSSGLTTTTATTAANDDERMKETKVEAPATERAEVPSFADKVIDSFNVRRNLAIVFRTDIGPQSLPVICGIKSISCFLILCFHMQWYTFFAIHNSAVMFHYAEQIRYQLVSNAPLLVDVFFAISGFLVTYNFIRNQGKLQEILANGYWQNVKLYGKMVLHRYLRLSPLYLMVTAVGELMTSYIVETSKFWVHERSDLRCQRFWWRNVLYIQNLFDIDELCLNWTWSLACEMQYYIIATVLLFVYAKNTRLGKSIFVAFAAATVAFNMAITLMHHFVPSYDVLYNTGSALYIAPWARMSPYVVGVYFGWQLSVTGGKLDVTDKQFRRTWVLVCASLILSMHSTIKRNFPFPLASTVMVLVRFMTSWSACWTITATAAGYSNLITRFLSAKFFIHINKLTYAIYLLNPLIITGVFGISDSSSNADPIPAVVMALGVTLLSYLAAIAFTVLFEIPYCTISSEILKLKKKPLPSAATGASPKKVE
ncbi:nose resistant to fluoxetine protein 6-like [Toxorhynchites rutilus septentrionalis]|uniref:nose resistant to fluoxetine protein 6-like n=1 Tax=Toxorhynchites rutilus septentrionalis TaxID=329112 RepID=UPI00247ADE11|nr:nose resistant to fluoxetine protein 6-like [Toxorhynchites rutilus septentrionalis]XP_055629858.1 nose resistant to fluoxetine protein 6-like [Toxorhynchites rutilus septentrionalis]XP_055629859.1 nose resistant to fluoxetine protein 6-like [Toxorhynchites rutilus septentrionalis]XP_055629860.1 nose resistant to fluoxetine protein 6-like [Toxorhynchites rutilus septentrionalis]